MGKLSEFLKREKSLRIQESLGRRDYSYYCLSNREILLGVVIGIIADMTLNYLFFRSAVFAVLLSPVVLVVLIFMRDRLGDSRRRRLRIQFRDAMQSISAALLAGYSMENAIGEAYKDMRSMYGESGMITQELGRICEGLRNACTSEELFKEFGFRSAIEEIKDFAEVYEIAKKCGGDLPSVIKTSTETIGGKIETEGEIDSAIASKRLEGRIMDLIPAVIILYIDFTSPGFFDSLYGTIVGRIVMIICFAGYLGAIVLSEKLMRIEV